jgi:hypothetical protein
MPKRCSYFLSCTNVKIRNAQRAVFLKINGMNTNQIK